MNARTIFNSCIALSFLACGGSGNSGSAAGTDQLVDVPAAPRTAKPVGVRKPPFEPFYTGVLTPSRLLLKDQRSWAAAWDLVVGPLSPRPPLPAVDFAEEMVVLLAMGQQPTGGYGIQIRKVLRDDKGTLFVPVHEFSPGVCPVSQGLTAPIDIVIVPRTEGSVLVVDDGTLPCSY